AEEMEGLPEGYFDTIVVNSVVQYFPSEEYLRRVIEGCVGLLREGGRLYLGDVRHLGLLKSLRTGVELRKLRKLRERGVAEAAAGVGRGDGRAGYRRHFRAGALSGGAEAGGRACGWDTEPSVEGRVRSSTEAGARGGISRGIERA